MTIRVGSTFTGIMGLDLAVLAVLDSKVVWTCECEPYPRAVIAERCPGLPCFDDICTMTMDRVFSAYKIDMLIGGPPCQPTSTAGNRKGEDDDRWLWPEFLRLARELGPSLVFVENPGALLTLDGGRSFGRILGTLSDLGFDAEWTSLRASDVGAPHRRERVFLLAWRRDLADADHQSSAGGQERQRPRHLAPGSRGGGERGDPPATCYPGDFDDTCNLDESVADAGRRGEQRCGGRFGLEGAQGLPRLEGTGPDAGGGAAGDRGADVADAGHDGRRGRCAPHDDDGGDASGHDADRCRADVDDADDERCQRSGARRAGRGEGAGARDGGVAGAGGEPLGDADGARREGPLQPQQQSEGRRGSAGAGEPPTDERVGDAARTRRQRLDAGQERAGLAPALGAGGRTAQLEQTQPRLGGDVDGVSDRLELHRWPAPPPSDEGAPAPQHDWEPPRTVGGPRGGGRHAPVAEVVLHRRPRLKALGNAVVPQQAAAALRILLQRAGLSHLMRSRRAA